MMSVEGGGEIVLVDPETIKIPSPFTERITTQTWEHPAVSIMKRYHDIKQDSHSQKWKIRIDLGTRCIETVALNISCTWRTMIVNPVCLFFSTQHIITQITKVASSSSLTITDLTGHHLYMSASSFQFLSNNYRVDRSTIFNFFYFIYNNGHSRHRSIQVCQLVHLQSMVKPWLIISILVVLYEMGQNHIATGFQQERDLR